MMPKNLVVSNWIAVDFIHYNKYNLPFLKGVLFVHPEYFFHLEKEVTQLSLQTGPYKITKDYMSKRM